MAVNQVGKQALADSGLTEQQDRCMLRCDLVNTKEDIREGRTLADDLAEVVPTGDYLLQVTKRPEPPINDEMPDATEVFENVPCQGDTSGATGAMESISISL